MKYLLSITITVLIILAVSCSMPTEPTFKKLEDVKFKSLSLSKKRVTLSANALFNNPNALSGQMKNMNLEVFVNGKKVSNLKQNVSSEIPAESDFKLPLEVEIPLNEVLKDIGSSLGGILKSPKIKYHLEGSATVSMAGIEASVPIYFEGEEELKLSAGNPLINTTIPFGN